MLIRTGNELFQLLAGEVLYQASLALDYTPDTAPVVVRFGASEYDKLLSAKPARPHIAVQFRRQTNNRLELPHMRKRGQTFYRYLNDVTKTDVIKNSPPTPRMEQYQLDIRSPNDLWLRQIEAELDRLFDPTLSMVLTDEFLGPVVGPIDIPIRFTLESPQRMPDFEDHVRSRYMRSTAILNVETWLLARAADMVQGKTVQEVQLTYLTLEGVDQGDPLIVTP